MKVIQKCAENLLRIKIRTNGLISFTKWAVMEQAKNLNFKTDEKLIGIQDNNCYVFHSQFELMRFRLKTLWKICKKKSYW